MFLHVGLSNGSLLRTNIDQITGTLTDTRTRVIGEKSVKLFKIKVKGKNAILALSTRAWLCYNYFTKYVMTPLSYETLDYASGFESNVCEEGIVGITGSIMKIITPEKLGEMFN